MNSDDTILVSYYIEDISVDKDLYILEATTEDEGIQRAFLSYKEWLWVCGELNQLQKDRAIISTIDEILLYQNDLDGLKSIRFLLQRSKQDALRILRPQWYASILVCYYADSNYHDVEWTIQTAEPERLA